MVISQQQKYPINCLFLYESDSNLIKVPVVGSDLIDLFYLMIT